MVSEHQADDTKGRFGVSKSPPVTACCWQTSGQPCSCCIVASHYQLSQVLQGSRAETMQTGSLISLHSTEHWRWHLLQRSRPVTKHWHSQWRPLVHVVKHCQLNFEMLQAALKFVPLGHGMVGSQAMCGVCVCVSVRLGAALGKGFVLQVLDPEAPGHF